MIGRGTYVPIFFAPGMNKEYFLIFDFCGILNILEITQMGDSKKQLTLSQQPSSTKLEIVMSYELQTPTESKRKFKSIYG
jgi:type I restriction enzyme R subunit